MQFVAGPRGLCFEKGDVVKCLGGIPTPRGGRVGGVVVSPGSDASACGLRDKRVVCWGEAYSPSDALDEPVPLVLESWAGPSEAAVVGTSNPGKWSASCIARQGCTLGATRLEACDRSVAARASNDVLASADALVGQVVSVRGPLGVGPMGGVETGCGAPDGWGCCNRIGAEIVLGVASPLSLEGYFCRGDDSQVCCNAPAYGQSVVATGRVARSRDMFGVVRWGLTQVRLCTE
jgi:hypothetical protein